MYGRPFLLAAIGALIAATCGHAQDIHPKAPAASAPAAQSAPIPIAGYVNHLQRPSFNVVTPGQNVLFGAVGGLIAITQGQDIADQYDIRDPSNVLGRELARGLAAAHGEDPAFEPVKVAEGHRTLDMSAGVVPADLRPARYVIEVTTTIEPTALSGDWTHYGLAFHARMRVIDTSQGKVVVKAACKLEQKRAPDAPTLDQLFASNAAHLKEMIGQATQECATRLKTETLKL